MTSQTPVTTCKLRREARKNGSDDSLSHATFATDTLPIHERTRAWQDISAPLFHVEPQEHALEGMINAYMLSDWMVGSIGCNAHRYFRDPSEGAKDGLDYYFLQYYRRGQLKGHCGDAEIDVSPGDLCFLDIRQGLNLSSTKMLSHTLVIPRHEFNLDPSSANLHGTVISRETPMGRLLGNHIRTLVDLLPHLTLQEGKHLKSCTRGLLVAWLDTMASRQTRQGTILRGLKQQLHAYIDEHLTDPSLGPVVLQQMFKISRTTLYRAFGKPGVSDYIRDRRLEAALRELRRDTATPVSQVAFRWGFTTERSFQRAFRNRYGMSPTEARQTSVDLLQLHSPLLALQDTMAYWSSRQSSGTSAMTGHRPEDSSTL